MSGGRPAIAADLVGRSTAPVHTEVDRRWTMAYAAGIDDVAGVYLDSSASAGIVAHPLFPVCVEWPVIVAAGSALPALGLVERSGATGLHAAHDLTIHRLVRPDETLRTELTVIGVASTRPGALVTLALRTSGPGGEPVATTRQDLLYLGAAVTGADRPAPPSDVPGRPDAVPAAGHHTIAVRAGAAHVYTECARIWNPIHTDAAVGAARGLASLPLHGTATLALAVSRLVDAYGDGDPATVRRIAGRFRAMVPMPCELTLTVSEPRAVDGGTARWFEVRTPEGAAAIDGGCAVMSSR
ncbi:MAG TPA: MaoC/PaaZ C-terminal domain-containing protein [Ilumatobacter sp.]|nr:MaoC/PaaZ C-terminal domain-containing protein [Ilumatobacter sp.]